MNIKNEIFEFKIKSSRNFKRKVYSVTKKDKEKNFNFSFVLLYKLEFSITIFEIKYITKLYPFFLSISKISTINLLSSKKEGIINFIKRFYQKSELTDLLNIGYIQSNSKFLPFSIAKIVLFLDYQNIKTLLKNKRNENLFSF